MSHDVVSVCEAINECRRQVMALHGGNLDHPALDHLEAAMDAVTAVAVQRVEDGEL